MRKKNLRVIVVLLIALLTMNMMPAVYAAEKVTSENTIIYLADGTVAYCINPTLNIPQDQEYTEIDFTVDNIQSSIDFEHQNVPKRFGKEDAGATYRALAWILQEGYPNKTSINGISLTVDQLKEVTNHAIAYVTERNQIDGTRNYMDELDVYLWAKYEYHNAHRSGTDPVSLAYQYLINTQEPAAETYQNIKLFKQSNNQAYQYIITYKAPQQATTPTLELTAQKTLTGGTLEEGQFSFELKDADGKVLQTKTNGADGTVTFDTITYSASDFGKTFDYTVSEKIEGADGVTYDETVYTVKVVIDDQGNLTYKMYKQGDGPAESVTDDQEYAADHFRPQGSGNNHCLTIDGKVAYCFNLVKDWPWIDEESPIDSNLNKNEGYKKLENVSNGDMGRYSNGATKDEVLKVIYNGYPYDNAGLKTKYGLNDDQFRAVTQVALWYYTEGAYANVDDSMTDQQRWNNTFMIINRGVGAYGIQGEGNFWEGADDVTKANMYKCMADLTGATVRYSQGTGFNANSVYYRGNTESLQEPAGNLTVDLFVHPTDGENIDEEEKIQNLLSVGTVNPVGGAAGAAGLEEVTAMTFENSIEPTADDKVGTLIITKTIEGDVTADEAEGALKFTVTGPDGNSAEYTLADFTNENGVYTLELKDIEVGEYTVEETTTDITGKTVTVTYSVDNGDEQAGTSATATLIANQELLVAFKNDYSDNVGNLVITKTIEGDVTPEEAAGAISFTVTGPDNFNETYTLADFTESNGVYTLTLNDVHVGQYTVEETTHDIDGTTVTVTYTVNGGQETEGDSTTAEVTNGGTATVAFNNNYSENVGNLVITKTIEGDVTPEEAAGAISFTVTGPDNFNETYTLADFTESNGVYTLTLNDVHVGQYTVEETTHDIDGTTVTVTYTVNGGQETEGDSTTAEVTNGGTATVAFNNNYSENVGNLVITKTIEGDVTAEEAAGAISFTVTGPDNFNETYTLADFTESNGVYTLTLNDVHVGQYTVEETTHDIDGTTVTVTYTVNGGQETEGDSTTAEVTNGGTATVAFNNNYSENVGNLVITKTIEGDVTAEEAAGAISFTVTGPDNFNETYTLADFTESNGVYTLTLNDVHVGQYTVEETTHDIDGTTVTVTYTVNGGQETEGDSTTAEVTNGGTATVAFNNNYSENVGNLVITKTIEGDVTAEEAAGAISFTVTGPDNFNETYTLADFTESNGVYTLTLNDVHVGQYTVEETTHDIDGKTVTVKYSVNGGAQAEGTEATATLAKGETLTVAFENNYVNDKGNLVITKTIEGDVTQEEAAGALTFKVTAPDGTSTNYTLADFTNANGKYTLELNDVLVGEYTVEETTYDIDGNAVTVKYSVNGGQQTNGTEATAKVTKNETATVDFTNSYSKDIGNLVITKTIKGDVTAEEAEGALTFKVTGPDGTSTEYTLADFTNNNGKYTLELNDVLAGEYKVEETTKDITGKTVTVKYSVNGGAQAEGTEATATLAKGETLTVAFENNYVNDKGNLVITKTIEGDVTPEEAAGALTFKVTAPDGTSTEYTLADFTNANGKYTLELNDVLVGEYTVEETTYDIEGNAVTVKYSVNNGQEQNGTEATAEVTKGQTATVDFTNSYSKDKGNLVITKTIKGDVTKEEAEGALTFKVTGPDGTSTEYTLKDFAEKDGVYTLELNDIEVGQYTVEETTKDIEGKTVTVKYSVNSGEAKEGSKAAAEVANGETVTVAFENNYVSDKTVTISKVDLGGAPLAGAHIQIKDKDGKVIKDYTSTTGTETINVAPGTYTFHEEAAPNGYKVVTDFSFTVAEDGTVELTNVAADVAKYVDGVMVVTDQYEEQNVVISKVDLGGQPLAGAHIQIKNAAGTVIKDYTSTAGTETITVTPGTYTFHEEAAPNGYKVVTDFTFTVAKDGTVTVNGVDTTVAKYEDGKLIVTDLAEETPEKPEEVTVAISKVDLGGQPLEGAHIVVTDKDGKVVADYTSTKEVKTITVEPGTYTFHEEAAPNGYKVVTDFTFTVAEDGTVTVNGVDTTVAKYEDGKLIVTDLAEETPEKPEEVTVAISKVDLGGAPLAGAHIQIKDKDGKVIKDYTSTTGTETINVAPGTYTFHEEAAPNGYKVVTDFSFTVAEDGTVELTNVAADVAKYVDGVMVVTDQYEEQNVVISKVDLGGQPLAGAHIQIKNAAGTVIKDYTSTTGTETIAVTPGTYTFHEEAAPNGYKVVTDFTFTVAEDGTVTVNGVDTTVAKYEDGKLIVTDLAEETPEEPKEVTVAISKVDLGGQPIEGAHIVVTDKDGNVVADYTSTKEVKTITVEPGTYTFHEEAAPNGYKVVTDFTFTVAEDGTVTVNGVDTTVAKYEDGKLIVTDLAEETPEEPKEVTVAISKVDLGGQPLEGAHIVVTDKDGKVVADYTSTKEVKTITVEPGTYTFHEEAAPNGYKVVTDFTFTVAEDGTVTVNGVDTTVAKYEDGKLIVTDLAEETPEEPKEVTVAISKVDLGGQPLEGAHIVVTDKDGKVVADYTSTKEVKTITVEPGTYTFHEEAAPNGYKVVTDFTFTVAEDGTVTVNGVDTTVAKYEDGKLIVTDLAEETPEEPKEVTVAISKVDLGGQPLEGAHIVVTDKDGKVVADYTSTKEVKTITVEPGTYTFHEEAAPNGYKVVTDFTFTVAEDGTVTVNGVDTTVAKYEDGKLIVTDLAEETPEKPDKPDEEKPENPGEEPDDEKPVETGDDTNIMLYVMLLELSLAACAVEVLNILKKKRNSNC